MLKCQITAGRYALLLPKTKTCSLEFYRQTPIVSHHLIFFKNIIFLAALLCTILCIPIVSENDTAA